jgi:hypothetical protein
LTMSETPINVFLSNNNIRKILYQGVWYYSAIDLVAIILDLSPKDAKNHFYTLKKRLRKETGNKSFNYKKLKLTSRDGKQYLTDVVTVEEFLRLVQSISSPNVEAIKVWMVQMSKEHLGNIPESD